MPIDNKTIVKLLTPELCIFFFLLYEEKLNEKPYGGVSAIPE